MSILTLTLCLLLLVGLAWTILTDGFSTIVAFPSHPAVKFKERSLKPPGFDAGGANDVTGMRNTRFRTRFPKKLITLTAMTGTVYYDPAVYTDVTAMLGDNQLITVTFPDGSTLAFYGWLDKFDPSETREGDAPTASITVEPSNQTDAGVETAPVVTAAS